MLRSRLQNQRGFYLSLLRFPPVVTLVFFYLFSRQDEQRKFIKFACNQERLPGRCSCQDGSTDIHVPPYPMKIGPPDGRGRL